MVKVKKRTGRIEEFMESKIVAACKKAGATAKEAGQVAKEVGTKVAHMTIVEAEHLSELVVTTLRKLNKAAADEFVKFRKAKYKAKK